MAICEAWPAKGKERGLLWDWMGKALLTAAAKCDDGDTDRFAALCLDTFRIDPAVAARHPGFARWVEAMAARDDAYRQAFVRHCGQKAAIVLIHARAAWEERKRLNPVGPGSDADAEGGVA